MNFLPLAQDANKAIGWVEQLIQGGPALIFGFFCVVLGAVIYYQNKKICELEKDYRETLTKQIKAATDNTERLIAVMTTTNNVVTACEKALRDNHDAMTRANAKMDAIERQGS